MPTRLSSSIAGARLAKDLLLKMERANVRCKAKTGELDIRCGAELLDHALNDERLRDGLLLALSEFIGTAIDGSPIDVHAWTPLEHFDPNGRPALDAKSPIKRRF